MNIFREFKAKKAAFGFTTEVGTSDIVSLGLFLATALHGSKMGKDFLLESNQSGSSHELKLYTDNPALAAHIRDLNSLGIPSDIQAFLDGGNLYEKALQARYAIGDELAGPNA